MAATSIEKIPPLKGDQAKDFVQKANSTSSRQIAISEQEKKIYQALTQNKNR